MTHAIGHVGNTPRRRFRASLRLGTMMLLVALAACALGMWHWWERRRAVDELLSRVPVSVFIRSSSTGPNDDPTYDPGGTFKAATHRVRELHQEKAAVAALRRALADARERGDEKRIRGALAALMDLGPDIASAGLEVVAIVRMNDANGDDPVHFVNVRMLAVHVLGKIAVVERAFLEDLIAAIFLPDHSLNRSVCQSAVGELVSFVQSGNVPATRLLAILEESMRRSDLAGHLKFDIRSQDLFGLFASLPGEVGNFRAVAPVLDSIVRDETRSSAIRHAALWATANLHDSRGTRAALERLSSYLDEVENDIGEAFSPRFFQALRFNLKQDIAALNRQGAEATSAIETRKTGDHAQQSTPFLRGTGHE